MHNMTFQSSQMSQQNPSEPSRANISDNVTKLDSDAMEVDEQEDDDSDSSTESGTESDKDAVRPPQVTFRRKVQNAKFSSW